MQVEIWSDVVCPWCYVGKRRFESALAGFDHAEDVEVVWRSFELDPNAPVRRGSTAEHLARKYGWSAEQVAASHERLTRLAAAEGLEYHLDETQGGNTFDAHRLLHAAQRPAGRTR
jgi:predicted DsbA family dithiol-disulfide isomerase